MNGIQIGGTTSIDNVVAGNYVGTDSTGKAALGNVGNGIEILELASENTIGGLTATPGSGLGNLISGNGFGTGGDGVLISGGGTDNVLLGNLIGTDVTGKLALANLGNGVELAVSRRRQHHRRRKQWRR